MQHLRFGKLFPMSWEPSRDMDRRQLEYVKPPEADGENTSVEVLVRNQSHKAQGYLDEFTAINILKRELQKLSVC